MLAAPVMCYISGTLKADNLHIDQSGASDLKGKLEVNKLTVDLSGASDITVNGTAHQFLSKPAVPAVSKDLISVPKFAMQGPAAPAISK